LTRVQDKHPPAEVHPLLGNSAYNEQVQICLVTFSFGCNECDLYYHVVKTMSSRIVKLGEDARSILNDLLHQDYRVRETMIGVAMSCDCAFHIQERIESGKLKVEAQSPVMPRLKD